MMNFSKYSSKGDEVAFIYNLGKGSLKLLYCII